MRSSLPALPLTASAYPVFKSFLMGGAILPLAGSQTNALQRNSGCPDPPLVHELAIHASPADGSQFPRRHWFQLKPCTKTLRPFVAALALVFAPISISDSPVVVPIQPSFLPSFQHSQSFVRKDSRVFTSLSCYTKLFKSKLLT